MGESNSYVRIYIGNPDQYANAFRNALRNFYLIEIPRRVIIDRGPEKTTQISQASLRNRQLSSFKLASCSSTPLGKSRSKPSLVISCRAAASRSK